ncbi:hypothetical protein Lal_00033574 [Lupinus albus]|nr:hypothetical protein Lal_00033574 [Lupinus albus]
MPRNPRDKSQKELEGLVYSDIPNEKLLFQSIELECPRPIMFLIRGGRLLKKFTFNSVLKTPLSYDYEKYNIPLFFTTLGFNIFRNRKISSVAGANREQLGGLDLRILIDSSLVE